jgi:hypothetical protein
MYLFEVGVVWIEEGAVIAVNFVLLPSDPG